MFSTRPSGRFHRANALHVLLRLSNAGRRKHLIKLALGKIASGIEVPDSMKDNPKVCVRMVDVVGCSCGES
jgi:hypothetical protein